ncbi:MAG TPA: LamG-like jellyroll fold domain-containing protein [Verrucomicrobiae bacterium]|nr:LamG-like jellyroll fold domain-containing protein [Verrucomicrobiae bacterium]
MKPKTLKKKAALKTPSLKSVSGVLSHALRFSRRHSAYAFVAGLGVWLPKADAATLVNLDATSQPLGPLAAWPNAGTLGGDFVTGAGATTNPTVVLKDGVNGIVFEADGGVAGAGSHYVGPIAPSSICTNNARTIEAWIHNDSPQDAEAIVGWGRRGADGLNNFLGHGGNTAWGGAEMWGAPDLGWGNTPAQVATNRVINRWTYIVQTFDGVTNRLYVDGRLANSEGPPATLLINTAEVADDGFTALPIRVARESEANGTVSTASVGTFVAGRIRIHDTALSSTTISNQFFIEKAAFNLNDTDTDGMPDWWEDRYGLNKNSAADATGDLDSDGLNNLGEYNAGTTPTVADTDGDSVSDGAEVNRIDPQTLSPAPTNPLSTDSDSDTLSDGVETDTGTFVSPTNTGSDPLKGDTDGDIASDGLEVSVGTDPNNASSTPSLARAIDLDATGLSGLLTNWVNTGFITGNFSVPTNATVPMVITNDGVKGVGLLGTPGGAGGTHYLGPATTADVTGAHPRTVEAWVFDPATAIQDEKIIIAWGSRNFTGGNVGADYPVGIGAHDTWGAVAYWGDPDIGWADQEVHGRWTHIATTWDGTTTRLYSDGVLANQESIPINTPLIAPGDSLPFRFRIGRQNGAANSTDIDNTGAGQVTIAKVRVYTNALDAATIRARFDSEKAAFGLTDPDGDGLPTWYEIRCNLNPNDATGANGAAGNPDNDGLTNLEEFALGTRADLADTDADGLSDGAELTRVDAGWPMPPTGAVSPTNPLNPDTDGDGLRDGVETDTGTYVSANNTGSDPLVQDSDNDGVTDGAEVAQGSNPVNPLVLPDPGPRINLVSTNLPLGGLNYWTNTGSFSNGYAFEAALGGGTVQTIQGVTALRLPGGGNNAPYYTGMTNVAAANLTGDPVYSIEAWVFNESAAGEEIIIAWGRRGANGLNNAFGHGTSADFGCMGHWGARDLGWNGVVNFNRWTYLVYTYDAISSTQRAWVDGVPVNQEVIADLAIPGVGTAAPAPFRIGAQNNDTGNVVNGDPGRAAGLSIGEVRVYNRVLSTNDIIANFNAGRAAYGLGDNDNDGITDWFERVYPGCLSELNPADAALDCDGDGLTNLQEFSNPNPAFAGIRTDPTNPDTDGDGVLDGEETSPTVRPFPTNPIDPDTDRDGLNDNVETGTGVYVSPANTGTIANFADSDGDTYPDNTEVAYRLSDGTTDPNNGASVPDTTSPVPVIRLDATGLPLGALGVWTNLSGLPHWSFNAPTNAIAEVALVDGTRGVVLNTTNYYTGHGAPAYMGGNASRTVEAWIWNPTRTGEETVFAWGRRGGPDGSNWSAIHGTDAAFGALGIWGGGPDVPWGVDAASINSNVVTSKWTYVAYTYDNVSGIRAAYRDGVLANSETNAVGVVLNTHVVNNLATADALPFRVGAQNEADGSRSGAAPPSMAIAKLRVHDQALTAAQIAATYNAERVQFPGQPRITNVSVNPTTGIVSFNWVPAPGHTYEVQGSTDAANPNGWSVLATGQSSGSFSHNPAGAPMNFYRLRIEP